MPEDLPTPDKSLKDLEKDTKRVDKTYDIIIIGCDGKWILIFLRRKILCLKKKNNFWKFFAFFMRITKIYS